MKRALGIPLMVVALLVGTVDSVTAKGAWFVDRIEDVDTVLAVRQEADFPIASLMRAHCDQVWFVQGPKGNGVETMRCQLSNEPVMIPEFQGVPPTTTMRFHEGPCVWTSDYWYARNESIVLASSVHYTITPRGRVYVTAFYPAKPLACE